MTRPAVRKHFLGCALLLGALAGCGGSSKPVNSEVRSSSPPPSIAELEQALRAELERLGKDTTRTTSEAEAPGGDENKVFDLRATPLELATPPVGKAPEGILLEWTEKLVGDYDANGLVSISDITPLASPNFWQQSISYVDPRAEGSRWPSSDGIAPAGLYDPIWRLARVDGDSNGLVVISDISPIAKHYSEQVEGYAVWSDPPGPDSSSQHVSDLFHWEEDFQPSLLSIPRAATYAPGTLAPDAEFGVHYVYFDQTAGTPGDYEFHVQPGVFQQTTEGAYYGPESFPVVASYPADPQPVDPGTAPPTVTLTTLGPQSGDAPLAVFFQAQAESPASETSAVFWDFDSDGIIDAASGRQLTTQHAYETAGHYYASVYVVEPGGRNAVAQLQIDALDNGNSLPVARLTIEPPTGSAPLDAVLDASGSSDAQGIALYEWDPEGTGTFVNTGAVPTLGHTYAQGEYAPVVRVRDTNGAISTATVHLSVGPPDSEPPTMTITSSLQGGEYAPETVDFTFTVNDPEDAPVSLEIDWEDDGAIDETIPALEGDNLVSHTFSMHGKFTVRARVTDDHTLSDETTYTLTLLENLPPDAQLISDVNFGAAPLTVNFDASGSSDPEGQTLSFHWDFNGDGNYEGPLSAQETFTYYRFGIRGAWMRVYDSEGAFDETAVSVQTTSGWEIGQQPIVSPTSANAPEVSAAIINGNPALAYVRNGELFYARAGNSEGSVWTFAVQLHGAEGGSIEPTLREINGVPAVAYQSNAGQLHFIRAQDANGLTWHAPQELAFLSGAGAGTDLEIVNGQPAIAWIDSLSELRYLRATNADGTAWGTIRNLGANGTFIFAQEFDLDVVAGLPAISASNGDAVMYHRAADVDGTFWASQTAVLDSTLRRSAAMTVPGGSPAGLPTVLYYNATGLFSTRAQDAGGSAWSQPVLISAEDTTPWSVLIAPEIEVKPVGAALATLTMDSGYFSSSDAFGNAWNEQFGIQDGNASVTIKGYDLVDAAGSPLLAIEANNGLVIARLR